MIRVRYLAVIPLVIFAVWLAVPAFGGYHLGYNGATDNECTSRIFQWCKHNSLIVGAGGDQGGPPSGLPDCQISRPPCYNNPTYP